MPVEDAYELAYREAVRALDHQLATLSELRSRASMLLAAASITMSLPGAQLPTGHRPSAWAALGAFVLLSGCVLAIVWPRGDWHFDMDPSDLLAKHLATRPVDVGSLHLNLVAYLTAARQANTRRLVRVSRAFRAGASLLAIQIVSTVAAATEII